MAIQRALCPLLIGRERELTVLEDALISANRGGGEMVLLTGDAGLGKSRLARALQDRARKLGMVSLLGSCSQADLSVPYLPFTEALGNHLATNLDDVVRRLGPSRAELARLFPQLREEGVSLAPDVDPGQDKLRLFESIVELLRVSAEANGLLLVIEDVHWADRSTTALLDYVARRVEGNRILLLVTYRTDELHRKHPLALVLQDWRRTRVAEVVELSPLPPIDIVAMVAAIFDTGPPSDEFRDLLYQRTEGNPFVLEETLKDALDRGAIYRTSDGWERKPLAEMRLPASVAESILLRTARLDPGQRDVLRTAAVLGQSFAYTTLITVSGKPEAAVLSAVQTCVEQQLMAEEQAAPRRYRFRHALTREAIYDEIFGPERDRLHLRAASVLRDEPGVTSMELASHLVSANAWDEALPMCLTAAEDAMRTNAFADAVALYNRVLPHTKDALMRGQILCQLGVAEFHARDVGVRAQPYLDEGIGLLEQFGRRSEAARYRIYLGLCHWEQSRPEAAMAEYEQARAYLEPGGASADLAMAYVRLAAMYGYQAETAASLAMAERAIATATDAGADGARIEGEMYRGMALAALGQVDTGIAAFQQAYEDARRLGLDWMAARTLGNEIEVELTHYRARQAVSRLDLFDPVTSAGWEVWARLLREGKLYAWGFGEPIKARALYEKALSHPSGQSETVRRWITLDLAFVYSTLGLPDEARRLLPEVEAGLEYQDFVSRLLAGIRMHLATGDRDRALQEAVIVYESADRGEDLNEKRWLFDSAVEALLSGSRGDEASELVARTRSTDPTDRNPHQQRMEGRLALARGDLSSAVEQLSAAAESFRDVGYRLEESTTRRALAEARLRSGDRSGAEAELRAVVAYADEFGAVVEGRVARARLKALGIAVEERAPAPMPQSSEGDLRPAGERLVTVLFIDVRGYTPMSLTESPAVMSDRISSLYRWARHEIERRQGLINHYAGDAVMATFNVGGTRVDHCVQALEAAQAIQDKAALIDLPVGAGLAVGPAIVGQLSESSPPTAIGETVNLAARLQAQAAAGEILISEEAYRRLRDRLTELGLNPATESLTLKGFEAPVKAYRLRSRRIRVGA